MQVKRYTAVFIHSTLLNITASTKICALWGIYGLIWAILAISSVQGQDKDEPVLKFYWDRARASLQSRDPLQHAVTYSFETNTLYKKVGKKGELTIADSTRSQYFYSFGHLDSTKVLKQPESSVPKVELSFPAVFDTAYRLNFFPNDTGGQLLAIGFDADTTSVDLPVGLVEIDRQKYYPCWLYLTYPAKPGLRHLTRSFRFTLLDGFIFPDSVWEVGVKDGFFVTTSYRLETKVTGLKIRR